MRRHACLLAVVASASATHCVTKQPYVCESLISDADAAKLAKAEGALEGVPTLWGRAAITTLLALSIRGTGTTFWST